LSEQQRKVTISIDLMGGDNSPLVPLQAISEMIKENHEVNFIAFGLEQKTTELINKFKFPEDRFTLIESKSQISEDIKPSKALRNSLGSSMRMTIEAVQEGKADAAISSGNTGGLMAIAMIVLKTIESIDRPAILAIIPRLSGKACLLDVGANSNCQSRNLSEFALLGTEFAKIILNKDSPSVGILNIGKEATKGNDLIKSSYEALLLSKLNFQGFVEANELLLGDVDVIISDGFSGNIALKAMEGAGKFCLEAIKQAANRSILAKFGLLLFKIFSSKKSVSLDPSEYNGGIFLGLNGIVVKSHGNANVKAFKTSIKHAIRLSEGKIIEKLKQEVKFTDD
jgi:glycerol-3-phosphate acyltransferase PlsX